MNNDMNQKSKSKSYSDGNRKNNSDSNANSESNSNGAVALCSAVALHALKESGCERQSRSQLLVICEKEKRQQSFCERLS